MTMIRYIYRIVDSEPSIVPVFPSPIPYIGLAFQGEKPEEHFEFIWQKRVGIHWVDLAEKHLENGRPKGYVYKQTSVRLIAQLSLKETIISQSEIKPQEPINEREQELVVWMPRYSDTSESDNMGRWARIGYVKGLQFFWIKKANDKFLVTGNFPVSSNDGSLFYKIVSTESEAKEVAEEALQFFLNRLSSQEEKQTRELREEEILSGYHSFITLSEIPNTAESLITYMNKAGYRITK